MGRARGGARAAPRLRKPTHHRPERYRTRQRSFTTITLLLKEREGPADECSHGVVASSPARSAASRSFGRRLSCYLGEFPMPERKAKIHIHTDGDRTPGRARAVVRAADLRPTDHVLDVGCGRPTRVQRAGERAAERGVRNATFEATTVQNYPFDPRSWDITLFMRIFGKGTGARAVGETELRRVLQATRRQAIVQAGKPRSEEGIRRILEVCDDEGFDAAWFVQLNLILANRRGAGARIHARPERVLVRTPAGRDLVPAATQPDHPMVRSFDPDFRAEG